ncbi:MAG: hypothetical protein HZB43_12645 [candidate division Zixibacteria bacterium]|nr:hypothetical protein [candidate division Zixibacteria bacterium]
MPILIEMDDGVLIRLQTLWLGWTEYRDWVRGTVDLEKRGFGKLVD